MIGLSVIWLSIMAVCYVSVCFIGQATMEMAPHATMYGQECRTDGGSNISMQERNGKTTHLNTNEFKVNLTHIAYAIGGFLLSMAAASLRLAIELRLDEEKMECVENSLNTENSAVVEPSRGEDEIDGIVDPSTACDAEAGFNTESSKISDLGQNITYTCSDVNNNRIDASITMLAHIPDDRRDEILSLTRQLEGLNREELDLNTTIWRHQHGLFKTFADSLLNKYSEKTKELQATVGKLAESYAEKAIEDSNDKQTAKQDLLEFALKGLRCVLGIYQQDFVLRCKDLAADYMSLHIKTPLANSRESREYVGRAVFCAESECKKLEDAQEESEGDTTEKLKLRQNLSAISQELEDKLKAVAAGGYYLGMDAESLFEELNMIQNTMSMNDKPDESSNSLAIDTNNQPPQTDLNGECQGIFTADNQLGSARALLSEMVQKLLPEGFGRGNPGEEEKRIATREANVHQDWIQERTKLEMANKQVEFSMGIMDSLEEKLGEVQELTNEVVNLKKELRKTTKAETVIQLNSKVDHLKAKLEEHVKLVTSRNKKLNEDIAAIGAIRFNDMTSVITYYEERGINSLRPMVSILAALDHLSYQNISAEQ